jgi:hypothetical protein
VQFGIEVQFGTDCADADDIRKKHPYLHLLIACDSHARLSRSAAI